MSNFTVDSDRDDYSIIDCAINCLLCAAIADPIEVIENTLIILESSQKKDIDENKPKDRSVELMQKRVEILEEKLKFLVENDSINDSSIDKEIRELLDT